MDCKQTSPLLNAYVDQELSKSDQSLVEAHLAECRQCREELEDIRKLDMHMQAESIPVPESLRSAIADRMEKAPRPSRSKLKETLTMRFRLGLAAVVAAGLIVVGVMSTGGSAQATLAKMRKAVTEVYSAHLKIQVNSGWDGQTISGEGKDVKVHKMDDSDFLNGGGNAFEFWSKNDRWRMSVFGGMEMIYKNGMMSMVVGDKVSASFKVDKADVPDKISEYLFKELSKAMDEVKDKANVRFVGKTQEDGRTLRELEVTGLEDEGKNVRLDYWVDEDTNLPTRFQVFANEEGTEKLVLTVTCEFNQEYPDSMFEPGGVEKP